MIDFLKARWICAGFSVLIFVVFVAGAWYKYSTKGSVFEYAIDFTGGTQALFKFAKPGVSTIVVRDILSKAGWPSATVREFGKGESEMMVRTKEVASDAKGLAERMRESIAASITDNQVTLMESQAVGESVGQVLRWNSIQAILFSILAILLYIAFRFWSGAFGVGAVVALVHDVVIMLGACIFLDIEISMTVIGAILALLGYSNNDTIVNFSQIRKNLKVMRGSSVYDIINTSVTQMLRRTILTSVATSLTVLAMLFFGGEALRDFSFIFLIGIIVGTYSSIYVASPIILWLYKE